MWLKFTKMHGAGNDFVVIDCISQQVNMTPERARKIADRHFGIGCDQILLVEPPEQMDVDFNYRIFNNDGSEVEQCGNGARCFAKYVRDRKLCGRNPIRVSTASGIIEITVNKDHTVNVDMGEPIFEPAAIPILAENKAPLYDVDIDGKELSFAAVSMGNPHAVITVEDIDIAPVESLGAQLESHPFFPKKVNVGFMQVVNDQEIRLRVFERGAGETLACGTGACAAVVAGIQTNRLRSPVDVHLAGGTLKIDWQDSRHSVILTGGAKTVFHGQIRI